MKKKGQGLSMNVIIIAALALLVLVIISVIFMSRTNIFIKDSKSCVQLGGTCTDVDGDCPGGLVKRPLAGIKCLDSSGVVIEDQVCCLPGEEV